MIEPAIQIHPMVPLAKASAILKISRDELIFRLSSGELLGEKRRIGESKKDSWFIYAEEFNRLLAQAVAKYEARVSTIGLEHFFGQGSGIRNTQLQPPAVAAEPPLVSVSVPLSTVAEMVAIEPVAINLAEGDQADIVDALGNDYALGTNYELSDYEADNVEASNAWAKSIRTSNIPANTTGALGITYTQSTASNTAGDISLHLGQAMAAHPLQLMQLIQHLEEERRSAEALKVRLSVLEEEMDLLRRELLARPDRQSHSPFSRMKSYFCLLLGKST